MHEAVNRGVNPFQGLLSPMPLHRLPAVGRVELVVHGKRVRKGERTSSVLNRPVADEQEREEQAADQAALRQARAKAGYRERYQRLKADPVKWAARQAAQAAKKEQTRLYQARYRAENRERIRAQGAAWGRRKRALMLPEEQAVLNAKQRAYYERTRDERVAKLREYRAKNRDAINARRRARKAELRAKAAAKTTNTKGQ